ncbi:hypothetical protein [Microvirga sp. G4-2]|uniref:hypothetical protein n=1 Tax=Microvirga sp. G4-2 TaxID=3434467 RepID=UPI004044ABC3
MIATKRGTRVIGGSSNYLAESDRYVVYHSVFPVIRISFSPLDPGGLRSVIVPRKSTWQSTLPALKLGIPQDIDVSAENTRMKAEFDDDGVLEFDLRGLLAGSTSTNGASQQMALPGIGEGSMEPLEEAKALIDRLGELFLDDEELQEKIEAEYGIAIRFVGSK